MAHTWLSRSVHCMSDEVRKGQESGQTVNTSYCIVTVAVCSGKRSIELRSLAWRPSVRLRFVCMSQQHIHRDSPGGSMWRVQRNRSSSLPCILGSGHGAVSVVRSSVSRHWLELQSTDANQRNLPLSASFFDPPNECRGIGCHCIYAGCLKPLPKHIVKSISCRSSRLL